MVAVADGSVTRVGTNRLGGNTVSVSSGNVDMLGKFNEFDYVKTESGTNLWVKR